MKRVSIVRAVAGGLVTLSALGVLLQSRWWLVLTFFVGLNLLQYGFTEWCLMEKLLKRFGVGSV